MIIPLASGLAFRGVAVAEIGYCCISCRGARNRRVPWVFKKFQGRSRGFKCDSESFRGVYGASRKCHDVSRAFQRFSRGFRSVVRSFNSVPKKFSGIKGCFRDFLGVSEAFQ